MQLGMIGLGRMGANMAHRLAERGHEVRGYDPNAAAREHFSARDLSAYDSLETMVAALSPPLAHVGGVAPRAVWIMVPAGQPVDDTIEKLLALLGEGDAIIDGGNSYYKDSMRRAAYVKEHGLHYIDAGVSGGIWGLEGGYSMMIGGDKDAVEHLRPIFEALAPAPDKGWGHVGRSGAGHFVKMIHNGIEYGMMQAYAEGFSILKHKEPFAIDTHQVAEIWREGSVIRSWLLDLTSDALKRNPSLDGIAPVVADSGEGRWTAFEAIDLNVPAPIITLSLLERIRSRDVDSFSDKLLSALRNEFGGHPMVKADALPSGSTTEKGLQ